MATGSSSVRGPTVTSPFNPWSTYYAEYQSDTDSTLRNSTPSYSSGSCTEDTVSDAANYMPLVSDLPPELYKAYQGLATVASYSREELMKLDDRTLQSNLDRINALLQNIIRAGYSVQWPEFENMIDSSQRITAVIDAKAAAAAPPKPVQQSREVDFRSVPGLEYAGGQNWVAMSGEAWREAWTDPADTNYIRGLYRNAMAPSIFSWDDVGAGPSEQPEQSNISPKISPDYTTYATRPKGTRPPTLDYCAIAYPSD